MKVLQKLVKKQEYRKVVLLLVVNTERIRLVDFDGSMKMNKHIYKNGNYIVIFDTDDGTKERITKADKFVAEFPESIDLSVTTVCDGGCEFCYQGCTPDGEHADILTHVFLRTLRPYTELAINGNDLSHPDLVEFLHMMKEKNIIVNMTVRQTHFMRKFDFIKQLKYCQQSKKLI